MQTLNKSPTFFQSNRSTIPSLIKKGKWRRISILLVGELSPVLAGTRDWTDGLTFHNSTYSTSSTWRILGLNKSEKRRCLFKSCLKSHRRSSYLSCFKGTGHICRSYCGGPSPRHDPTAFKLPRTMLLSTSGHAQVSSTVQCSAVQRCTVPTVR